MKSTACTPYHLSQLLEAVQLQEIVQGWIWHTVQSLPTSVTPSLRKVWTAKKDVQGASRLDLAEEKANTNVLQNLYREINLRCALVEPLSHDSNLNRASSHAPRIRRVLCEVFWTLVWSYVDGSAAPDDVKSHTNVSLPLEEQGAMMRLRSKLTGRFAGMLQSRYRGGFRPVICEDQTLGMHELGVPVNLAQACLVTDQLQTQDMLRNVYSDTAKRWFAHVEAVYRPTSTLVQQCTGDLWQDLHNTTCYRPLPRDATLQMWDVAVRQVWEGDYALFNRKPALGHDSLTAYRVRLIQRPGTVVYVNTMVCQPQEADYDGDAVEVYILTDEDAIHELKTVLWSSVRGSRTEIDFRGGLILSQLAAVRWLMQEDELPSQLVESWLHQLGLDRDAEDSFETQSYSGIEVWNQLPWPDELHYMDPDMQSSLVHYGLWIDHPTQQSWAGHKAVFGASTTSVFRHVLERFPRAYEKLCNSVHGLLQLYVQQRKAMTLDPWQPVTGRLDTSQDWSAFTEQWEADVKVDGAHGQRFGDNVATLAFETAAKGKTEDLMGMTEGFGPAPERCGEGHIQSDVLQKYPTLRLDDGGTFYQGFNPMQAFVRAKAARGPLVEKQFSDHHASVAIISALRDKVIKIHSTPHLHSTTHTHTHTHTHPIRVKQPLLVCIMIPVGLWWATLAYLR